MSGRRSSAMRRFDKRGALAIEASALLDSFFVDEDATPNRVVGNATIIEICGPLEQHRHSWWDSYEAIAERVAAACLDAPSTIALHISSPGGDAAGCCELARQLRAMAAAHQKRLIAYVDERACSAAYAIACAAERIFAADTALVGSIGILATRVDVSARNTAEGLRVLFVASGARKADGNPELPVSDAEIESQQRIVDGLAIVLFELVRELRGLEAEPLQAAVFCARDALAQGLIDEIATLPVALATQRMETPMDEETDDKKDDMGALRAKLAKLAESDTPEGRKAKRALAALDAEDEPAAEGDEEAEPAAEDDPKKEAARAYTMAARANAAVHKLRAEVAAERLSSERAQLLATRPDFDADFLKTLARAPLDVVRELVKSTPRFKPDAGASAALAAQQVGFTRGDETQQPVNQSSADVIALLDREMGLMTAVTGVVETPYKMQLGATVPRSQLQKGGK